jgi:hypothetical protein
MDHEKHHRFARLPTMTILHRPARCAGSEFGLPNGWASEASEGVSYGIDYYCIFPVAQSLPTYVPPFFPRNAPVVVRSRKTVAMQDY